MIPLDTPVGTPCRANFTDRTKRILHRDDALQLNHLVGKLSKMRADGECVWNCAGLSVRLQVSDLELYPPAQEAPQEPSAERLAQEIYGSKATIEEFRAAVEPAMKFLCDHFDPHTKIILDCTSAEILSGLDSHITLKFVRD